MKKFIVALILVGVAILLAGVAKVPSTYFGVTEAITAGLIDTIALVIGFLFCGVGTQLAIFKFYKKWQIIS